jgi:hypothetical protein
MKRFVSALLFAHGIAHLVGFAWPWWVMEPLPPSATDVALIGDPGMQAVSLLWLVGAAAFVVAALALLINARVWRPLTMAAAALSLALSVLCWPASLLGVPINLTILLLLDRTRESSWPMETRVRHPARWTISGHSP